MYSRNSSTLCLTALLAFLIGFCTSNTAAQNVDQNIKLPNPTDPYGVGRVSYDWIDEHRSDPSNNSAKREIMVDIWYPADVSQGASKAPLLPGASRLTGISEESMRDGQFQQAWPAVRTPKEDECRTARSRPTTTKRREIRPRGGPHLQHPSCNPLPDPSASKPGGYENINLTGALFWNHPGNRDRRERQSWNRTDGLPKTSNMNKLLTADAAQSIPNRCDHHPGGGYIDAGG
jgi:hypothetical protein